MAVTYQQTDTSATFNVGCSGQTAGATTAARAASVGGTAGSSEVTIDTGNNVTRAIFGIECTAPNLATWTSGTWTVNVNITTQDAGTTLEQVHICDKNGGSYTTVASVTGLADGATGVRTINVTQGSDHTPQSQASSVPFVVLVFRNTDPHGGSATGITPSSTVVAPYTISVTRNLTSTQASSAAASSDSQLLTKLLDTQASVVSASTGSSLLAAIASAQAAAVQSTTDSSIVTSLAATQAAAVSGTAESGLLSGLSSTQTGVVAASSENAVSVALAGSQPTVVLASSDSSVSAIQFASTQASSLSTQCYPYAIGGYDDFERDDASDIGSEGSLWTNIGVAQKITSGKLLPTTGSHSHSRHDYAFGGSYAVEVIRANTALYAGPEVGHSSGAFAGCYAFYHDGTSWLLRRYSTTTNFATIGTLTEAQPSAPYTMRMEFNPSTGALVCKVNGVTKISTTDGTYSGGFAGVFGYGTTAQVDSFSAEAVSGTVSLSSTQNSSISASSDSKLAVPVLVAQQAVVSASSSSKLLASLFSTQTSSLTAAADSMVDGSFNTAWAARRNAVIGGGLI